MAVAVSTHARAVAAHRVQGSLAGLEMGVRPGQHRNISRECGARATAGADHTAAAGEIKVNCIVGGRGEGCFVASPRTWRRSWGAAAPNCKVGS